MSGSVAVNEDGWATRLKPRPDSPEYLEMQRLVRGKNINEKTLLATDYLNHFNEIIMILDMLPSFPDCFDEAREWQPKNYEEHFRNSGFSDRELAISAYEHSPRRFRKPFDDTIDAMNQLILSALDDIETAISENSNEEVARIVSATNTTMRRLTDVVSAVIHGGEDTAQQAEIVSILAD